VLFKTQDCSKVNGDILQKIGGGVLHFSGGAPGPGFDPQHCKIIIIIINNEFSRNGVRPGFL
jgi:hypothetical protein